MNPSQHKKYQSLYQQHVNALHRQGKAETTIEVYSRAVRRVTEFFDLCPDQLNQSHLKDYFSALVKSHSWSTVKVDRNGLQFFFKYVLERQWIWVDIVKPPQTRVLPDILSVKEVERVINGTRELRYQTFLLTAYSMGLRRYWATHRHPQFIFPTGKTDALRHQATQVMDRGGLQKSFKVIVRSCGIHKRVTIHSLRHCYGAHLVEAGLNLRAIQQEMGHECPKTTALYTQLTEVAHQNTSQVINRLVSRLRLKLDGEV
jgi:integrase/recombinase XerD